MFCISYPFFIRTYREMTMMWIASWACSRIQSCRWTKLGSGHSSKMYHWLRNGWNVMPTIFTVNWIDRMLYGGLYSGLLRLSCPAIRIIFRIETEHRHYEPFCRTVTVRAVPDPQGSIILRFVTMHYPQIPYRGEQKSKRLPCQFLDRPIYYYQNNPIVVR